MSADVVFEDPRTTAADRRAGHTAHTERSVRPSSFPILVRPHTASRRHAEQTLIAVVKISQTTREEGRAVVRTTVADTGDLRIPYYVAQPTACGRSYVSIGQGK